MSSHAIALVTSLNTMSSRAAPRKPRKLISIAPVKAPANKQYE